MWKYLDFFRRLFVLDANVSGSADLRALKQTLADIKTEIVDVSLDLLNSLEGGRYFFTYLHVDTVRVR